MERARAWALRLLFEGGGFPTNPARFGLWGGPSPPACSAFSTFFRYICTRSSSRFTGWSAVDTPCVLRYTAQPCHSHPQ